MIKDRIYTFVKSQGLTIKAFEERCGLSNGYVSSMRKGLGVSKLDSVLSAFPNLNRDWLLTGEGEMLRDSDIPKQGELVDFDMEDTPRPTVPLIPIGAFAGQVHGFSAEGVILDRCEQVPAPIDGCDIAIDVSGDSMEPDFPNGCRVFCKRIYEEIFIAWGNVFVLDTCNGAFIKRVYPSTDPALIEARSINPDYPTFNIPKTSIFGMYRVLMMARGYSAS